METLHLRPVSLVTLVPKSKVQRVPYPDPTTNVSVDRSRARRPRPRVKESYQRGVTGLRSISLRKRTSSHMVDGSGLLRAIQDRHAGLILMINDTIVSRDPRCLSLLSYASAGCSCRASPSGWHNSYANRPLSLDELDHTECSSSSSSSSPSKKSTSLSEGGAPTSDLRLGSLRNAWRRRD